MLWGGVKDAVGWDQDAVGVCISTISAAREDSSSPQAAYVAPQPCSAFPDLAPLSNQPLPAPLPPRPFLVFVFVFPPPDCVNLCCLLGSSQPWLGSWRMGMGCLAIILLRELSL